MSSKYKEDEYVRCPYYRKESNTELKCVGICGDYTINYFQRVSDKQDYKDDFCVGYYWNCPLYRSLEEDGK